MLVVEDEVGLCDLLRTHLEAEGHQVRQAFDGPTAIREADRFEAELVVLDWMLPGQDGLSVCRQLRSRHLMPVILLTARAEEADRVIGLEVGADDYVVKPFSIPELLARIRAQLRRVAMLDASAASPEGVLVRGQLVVDGAGNIASLGGVRLDLTRRELELLALLATHPGRTFTREYLLDRVWGSDYEGLDRAVDTAMARMRRKLGDFGGCLEAVWGIGYRFRSKMPS